MGIKVHIFGLIVLAAAGLTAFLGMLSLPPGGLMFALPCFLFMAASILGIIGGICLWGVKVLELRSYSRSSNPET